MPTISVIVPVYKVEKYINKCVDSILNQTFTDIEVILVNDGSPDNCGRICDEYSKLYNRVKVIHKENGGLADARNAGLEIATGMFVSFIDSDDYIDSDMYEKLLNACLKHGADISMCGRYNVFEHENVPLFSFNGTKVWSNKEAIGNLLTWNNIDSSSCDKLFNRKLFEDIRFPVGRYNEDIFVMTMILYKANKVVHIGESKYYYYQRNNSITTEEFSERKMDLLDASESVLDFVSKEYPDLKPKALSFYYKGIIYLLSLLQSEDHKNSYKANYKKLKRLLLLNINNVLFSQYINKRRKLDSILMLTNTYNLYYRK
ncbi:MAG: glycosyl transferase family 2 [Bacillales bacterium]|jgi:glycosyltransferase involved in cell wall biosynthesis|nr:glycosyl transferase family 2 [Bacillales bacterium]